MVLSNRTIAVLGTGCVALTLSTSSYADTFYDLGGELLSNDNVGRAKQAVDIREDSSLALAATAGYFYQPGDYTSFTLLGNLEAMKYDTYDGMDHLSVGVGGAIGHKFGIGDNVPSLDLALNINRDTFDDGVRDVWRYSASATLTRRLSERLLGGIGLSYETRDGDHDLIAMDEGPGPGPGADPMDRPKPGDSFSTDSAALFAFADLDLTELTWLSAGYQFADGEFTSTSTPNDRIVAAATAITNDRVFDQDQFAYRLDGRSHRYNLDWNRAIMETGTFLIGIEYQDFEADNGVDYSVTLLRAGLLFSF